MRRLLLAVTYTLAALGAADAYAEGFAALVSPPRFEVKGQSRRDAARRCSS